MTLVVLIAVALVLIVAVAFWHADRERRAEDSWWAERQKDEREWLERERRTWHFVTDEERAEIDDVIDRLHGL